MDFQPEIILNALPLLAEGLNMTLRFSAAAFALALVLGFAVGVLRYKSTLLYRLLAPYVEIARGTPLLIQLYFIYYGLPSLGITLGCFTAGVLGLGLNSGAYISEIVRGALYGVGRGQAEAAAAMGLTWFQTMVLVVVPQAMRTALPPLVNAFSATIKDSSLVSVIAVTELTRASQLVYTRTFRAFEIYLVVGLAYLAVILSISFISGKLESRLAIRNH
ncbi:MAG: amino acid ABC transporter permease [Desulfobacter sp.]|nr:MAG: amino acid ABC transporter permease [Desulfobacter sp.]